MSEPNSSLLLYQTKDGRTRIECRFENESVWLTQKLMAEPLRADAKQPLMRIRTRADRRPKLHQVAAGAVMAEWAPRRGV